MNFLAVPYLHESPMKTDVLQTVRLDLLFAESKVVFRKRYSKEICLFQIPLALKFRYFRNSISDKYACLSENEPNLNLFNKTKHFWYFERVLLPRKVSKKFARVQKSYWTIFHH